MLLLKRCVISTNRDAPGTPLGSPLRQGIAVFAVAQSRDTLLIFLIVLEVLVAENAVEKPTPPDIVSVDDATVSELNPLSRVVHPEEIEIEGRLDDSKNDGHGIRFPVVGIELSPDPVQAVQSSVGAQGNEVEGIDDGRDARLSEEKELGQDTDRFENLREIPDPL